MILLRRDGAERAALATAVTMILAMAYAMPAEAQSAGQTITFQISDVQFSGAATRGGPLRGPAGSLRGTVTIQLTNDPTSAPFVTEKVAAANIVTTTAGSGTGYPGHTYTEASESSAKINYNSSAQASFVIRNADRSLAGLALTFYLSGGPNGFYYAEECEIPPDITVATQICRDTDTYPAAATGTDAAPAATATSPSGPEMDQGSGQSAPDGSSPDGSDSGDDSGGP